MSNKGCIALPMVLTRYRTWRSCISSLQHITCCWTARVAVPLTMAGLETDG